VASIIDYIYPQIVWRDREKRLWNPIHRKALKNRPEERVRLRTIEYLLRAGWSKHRISTEEAIGRIGEKAMRTDIICYTQQFEPKLLIECKAEQVSISAKTAEQVARYNHKVGAPYLLMTNGISDFWYKISDESVKVVRGDIPGFLGKSEGEKSYYFEAWESRGFAGRKASPDLRKWLEQLLPDIWLQSGADSAIRYLDFSDGPSDLDLSHYYRIRKLSKDKRLALTTVNTAFGGNRMVIILNRNNENKAVMEVNLDLVFDEKKGNTSLYFSSGIQVFDFHTYWDLTTISSVDSIEEQADRIFSEYLE
jgi:hypothetical protein